MVILLRMQRIGEFMLGRTWLLRSQEGGRRERGYHSHAHLPELEKLKLELEKLKLLSWPSLDTGEVAVGHPPASNRPTEIGGGGQSRTHSLGGAQGVIGESLTIVLQCLLSSRA